MSAYSESLEYSVLWGSTNILNAEIIFTILTSILRSFLLKEHRILELQGFHSFGLITFFYRHENGGPTMLNNLPGYHRTE